MHQILTAGTVASSSCERHLICKNNAQCTIFDLKLFFERLLLILHLKILHDTKRFETCKLTVSFDLIKELLFPFSSFLKKKK